MRPRGGAGGGAGDWPGARTAVTAGAPWSRSRGSTDSEEEDDDEDEDEDGRARGRLGPPCYPSAGRQPPGPSWTAAFDPVPTDGPAGPQDCRDREPRGEHPDLPAPSPAGPATPSTLQLRSQDPAPHSAPQEATDGSKAAEPAAPCQALLSVGDLQAGLRGTRSAPSSLDSATRDPATSVPAPGAHQPPQPPEGEKSPESSGLPQSQSALVLQPLPMPNGSAPGGPAAPGSQ